MMRRAAGALADDLLRGQRRLLPLTTWMPRLYRARSLINRRAQHTLDAACGTGEFTVWMARQGLDVSGVNISERELSVARENAARAGCCIDFRAADLSARTPFSDGAFDQIVSLDTIVHIPDTDAVFREFHRLLVPDGHAVISLAAFAPSGRGDLFSAEGIVRRWTPDILQAPPIWKEKSWLALSPREQQDRFRQHRFYTLEDLREQINGLFEIVRYEYALHLFTTLATDIVFGIRGCRYFEPLLFFTGARLDRLLFSPLKPGYLLMAVLKRTARKG